MTKADTTAQDKAGSMRAGIVGTGIVGGATACAFAKWKHRVFVYDTDAGKVAELKKLRPDITACGSILGLVNNADIIFECVPTENKSDKNEYGGRIDLTILEDVAREFATACVAVRRYPIFVQRSTCTVGTAKHINGIIEGIAGLCHYAVNPSFLLEEDNMATAVKPEKVMIGAREDGVARLMERFYAGKPLIFTGTWEEIEIAKYAMNFLLPTAISFWNELRPLIDINKGRLDFIIEAATAGLIRDFNVGIGGAYDGACFPKDTAALVSVMEDLGLEPRLTKAVVQINDEVRARDGVSRITYRQHRGLIG